MSRVRIWCGSTPWLVTRHDDQRAVLSHPESSTDADCPGYPLSAGLFRAPGMRKRSLPTMDAPEHMSLRQILGKDLTTKRAESLRPRFPQVADGLPDTMSAGLAPVDQVTAFAQAVAAGMICELLGMPAEDHEFIQRQNDALVTRRASPSRPKPPESRSAAGGHETTTGMIALGTVALLRLPEELAKLWEAEDLQTINRTVELLRHLDGTHSGRRPLAVADLEIGGQFIRAGNGVIAHGPIGSRDVPGFPAPDRLGLDRGATNHITFPFGPHRSIGGTLASTAQGRPRHARPPHPDPASGDPIRSGAFQTRHAHLRRSWAGHGLATASDVLGHRTPFRPSRVGVLHV